VNISGVYLMKMPQLTTYEVTELSGKTIMVHCIMATGAGNEAQLDQVYTLFLIIPSLFSLFFSNC